MTAGSTSTALLSSPFGASNVVEFRLSGSAETDFVSVPSGATSRLTTSPVLDWASTVTPPDFSSAVMTAAGEDGVTSWVTIWPFAAWTVTAMVSPVTSSVALGPDAVATRFPLASVRFTAGSLDTIEFAPISTGTFLLPGVFTWAMPEGVMAKMEVVPENRNFARRPPARVVVVPSLFFFVTGTTIQADGGWTAQ